MGPCQHQKVVGADCGPFEEERASRVTNIIVRRDSRGIGLVVLLEGSLVTVIHELGHADDTIKGSAGGDCSLAGRLGRSCERDGREREN